MLLKICMPPFLLYFLHFLSPTSMQLHVLRKAREDKQHFSIGVPERKLMILFWFAVVGAIIDTVSISEYARRADAFRTELTKYFTCEFNGHNLASPCDRERVELFPPIHLIIVLITRGFRPLANMVFIISFKSLKTIFLKAQTSITGSSRT